MKKELTKFENLFGNKVDYSFLGENELIKLTEQEELSLKEGAILKAVNRKTQIILGREITNSGGQGIIFDCNLAGYVVKIYRKAFRTKYTQKKIEALTQYKNENIQICWPVDVITTNSNMFVGFLMPYAEGKNLYSLTSNPARVKFRYPGYNRLTQINMILDILDKFIYLHKMNVLVGDVKLENIIFDEKFKITLIDMDSVQAGEFPCDSSTPGYDCREVILARGKDKYKEKYKDGIYKFNKYYRDYYRKYEHECYAITVLIYKLLMNGKFPYTYSDFGMLNDDVNIYEDIQLCVDLNFPYSQNQNETKETCGEKAIWSHLPSFVKNAFVASFKENFRYTPSDWMRIFEFYKQLLVKEELADNDNECMNPFPENEIDYNLVERKMSEVHSARGFAMWQAVGRVIKAFDDKQLMKHLLEISEALKYCSTYKKGKYRFTLVYNLGILKKVKAEAELI